MFPSKPWTVASQQRNLREEDDAAAAFVLHGHAENVEAIADDVSEATNRRDATILRGSAIPSKAPTLPLEILDVAVDSEENNPPQPLTAPVLKGRRLFHSPDGRCSGSAPTKRSRAATACSTTRNVGKNRPKFKATHDMDFNRQDTLLFNYLFSDGHSDEETLVRMLQYRLTRRHIQTLIPGRTIDGRVVEMVAMRNTCSIQHVRHPFFWCLPPAFAEDVTKELPLEELTETYIPFWVKPSRFLNHIFVPIEDILGHWYCMVIDFVDKAAYHLDSYPDANMIPGREQLMKDILGRIHDLMTSPAYGPLKVNTPSNLRDWPIRRGQGIPNCNTSDSSGAWVISWLDPEGCFNSLDISGVLDDSTLRGKTAVSVVGGPFNGIGGLIRLKAQRWQRGGST